MTFTVSTIDTGVVRLAVEGELDVMSAPDLRKEIDKLTAATPKRVEIDLSLLRMVDSSGVGAIVSLYKRISGQGGEVVVTGLRDQPLAIFRLLRLDRVMVGADLPSPGARAQTTPNR
jgi:anti-sigma B factor antagonist